MASCTGAAKGVLQIASGFVGQGRALKSATCHTFTVGGNYFRTMKCLFTLLTIIASTSTWGQEYLVDLRIQKIVYMGDSLVYKIPKTFESTTTQVTPIIEIGKIGNNMFGVQVELIKSKLGQNDRFIAGRVYYIKKGKTSDWEKLLTSIHQRVRVDELKTRIKEEDGQKTIREEKDPKTRKMYVATDSDSMQDEFGVYYYNYFYHKK